MPTPIQIEFGGGMVGASDLRYNGRCTSLLQYFTLKT
jgi:hypothetical protein